MAGKRKPNISWGDDITDVLRMLNNAIRKGKVEQVQRVAPRITRQMTKQGKTGNSIKVKKTVKQGIESRRTRIADEARAQAAIRNREIIRKGTKAANMGTAAKAATEKGTVIRRGKEMPVGAEKAKVMRKQAGAAAAQKTRGNASKKAAQDALRKQANDRSLNAQARLNARRKLRAHEDKYGKFN